MILTLQNYCWIFKKYTKIPHALYHCVICQLVWMPVCSLPVCCLPACYLPVCSLPVCSLPIGSLPVGSLPVCCHIFCQCVLYQHVLCQHVSIHCTLALFSLLSTSMYCVFCQSILCFLPACPRPSHDLMKVSPANRTLMSYLLIHYLISDLISFTTPLYIIMCMCTA